MKNNKLLNEWEFRKISVNLHLVVKRVLNLISMIIDKVVLAEIPTMLIKNKWKKLLSK